MPVRMERYAARRHQVAAALIANPATPNTSLMAQLHVGAATVRAVRVELELAGVIPRARRWGLTDAAQFVDDYEFLRSQGISNADIASRFGILPESLERRARRHECWRPERGAA